MKKLLIVSFLIAWSLLSFAQKGTIRGTVIEEETGEPLFSVTVIIAGTSTGAVTDFDGHFSFQVDPGVYDLRASFVSLKTTVITGVEVKSDEVTVIDQIFLQPDVEELEAVVVSGQVTKSTEAALMAVKRKSPNVMDGISSASFRKIGDSDAAGAIKRVTGVSVEGGKYVYVRGLGDRYTKTMLNGVDIPGLDPDRNSLQIDIFPTSLLNNMMIFKTASADKPADFTGGLVNIETKDFPEEKIFDVSLGITYNPSMHFKSDALTYKGSSTDWLGFDSGLRDIPGQVDNAKLPIPYFNTEKEVYNVSKLFTQQLAAQEQTNFMNYSLGFSFGDQKNLSNGHSFGYFFTGNYKKNNKFYQDVFFGEYQKRDALEAYEMGAATLRSGAISTENTLLSGLFGLAYKTQNSKFKLSVNRLQNGEKKTARINTVSDPDDDFDPRLISDYTAFNDNLEYGQRGFTNILLNGVHYFEGKSWKLDWKLSPTFSSMTDPDIRRAAFSDDAGFNRINAGAAGFPTRRWRFLDEKSAAAKVDLQNNTSLFNRDATYRVGMSYVSKIRDYSIQAFNITSRTGSSSWDDGISFDEIVSDENLYGNSSSVAGNDIYYQRDGGINPNSNAYESTNFNLAGYASAEISISERLKTILGLRIEHFEQIHTGMNQQAANQLRNAADAATRSALITQIRSGEIDGAYLLNDDKVLSSIDFFPSLNVIYALRDDQNFRFSYSKTIARPSFKELSYAQILDPVSNRIFNGGFFQYYDSDGSIVWDGNLKETRINNLDLRWELFQKRGQLISLSAFYKTFDAPIELVRIANSQSGNEFQPRNVGNGQILGAELEFRKALDFLAASWLKNLSAFGNVTLVDSRIEMTKMEYNSRLVYQKTDEVVKDSRVMVGQAPFVINFGLQYNNPSKIFDAGLFYNVKGKTLTVVGEGFFPDIYSQPFHSLNFNLNKAIGKNKQTIINFSINNILNDKREDFFEAYNAQDQIFNQFTPGTEVGLGIKYAF